MHLTRELSQTTLTLATRAFARALKKSRPEVSLSPVGYVGSIDDNLVTGVERRQFEDDLAQGDGNELAEKFLAAHSSSALAVNSFAPFKDVPSDLVLGRLVGFESVKFERKCPTGIRGGTPPNLDLVASNADRVVGVESKCLEYLRSRSTTQTGSAFQTAYFEQIRDARRRGPWFQAMRNFSHSEPFLHLDAAQLIKHAFGLAHCFKERRVTLLYLFWEPSDAADFQIFAFHRSEIARFSQTVEGGFPCFRAMSYPELWSLWSEKIRPPWLIAHAANLRKRYLMPLS